MAKLDLNRKLQIVAVACIAIVFSASAITLYDSQRTLTAKDFPIEVDLNRSVFYVGENVTFTASIINRSGRDVNISSNGVQPAAWFYNINDKPIFAEISPLAFQYLKPNEQISRTYEFKTTEPGTYVLYVHYHIGINVWFEQYRNITVEVR
jgi:hypothetical protein